MSKHILDCFKDPGPRPEAAAGEEPVGAVERLKWLKQNELESRWLDQNRQFLLAEKVKILEAIPPESRTLEQSVLYLIAMDLLARDLYDTHSLMSLLFP